MAKETRTHLLVVEYDEAQEGFLETFGVSKEEMSQFLNAFVKASDKEPSATFTGKMMELINKGKVSGGLLIALATHDVMQMLQQRQAQATLGHFLKEILKNGEGGLGGFLDGLTDDEDNPDGEGS